MVWAYRHIKATEIGGLFHILVDFWLNQADRDAGLPPVHSNDFINDCSLWPDEQTVYEPFSIKTGLQVPRELVMKGDPDIEARPVTIVSDRAGWIQLKTAKYATEARTAPRQLVTNRINTSVALKDTDAMIERPEIQALKASVTTDGVDDRAELVALIADLSRIVDVHP